MMNPSVPNALSKIRIIAIAIGLYMLAVTNRYSAVEICPIAPKKSLRQLLENLDQTPDTK